MRETRTLVIDSLSKLFSALADCGDRLNPAVQEIAVAVQARLGGNSMARAQAAHLIRALRFIRLRVSNERELRMSVQVLNLFPGILKKAKLNLVKLALCESLASFRVLVVLFSHLQLIIPTIL